MAERGAGYSDARCENARACGLERRLGGREAVAVRRRHLAGWKGVVQKRGAQMETTRVDCLQSVDRQAVDRADRRLLIQGSAMLLRVWLTSHVECE